MTYDAPNQQVVRPDGSAPWDEGEGGSTGSGTAERGLDQFTKAELLTYAADHGIDADDTLTKAEIRDLIGA